MCVVRPDPRGIEVFRVGRTEYILQQRVDIFSVEGYDTGRCTIVGRAHRHCGGGITERIDRQVKIQGGIRRAQTGDVCGGTRPRRAGEDDGGIDQKPTTSVRNRNAGNGTSCGCGHMRGGTIAPTRTDTLTDRDEVTNLIFGACGADGDAGNDRQNCCFDLRRRIDIQ